MADRPEPGSAGRRTGTAGPETGPPAPVTLIVGPEELLAERAVGAAVQAARSTRPGAELRELAAAEVSAGMLLELVSPSLFASATVLVLREVQDAREDLVGPLSDYVRAPAEDVVLVLVHRGGQKGRRLLEAARKAGAAEVSCAEPRGRRERLRFLEAEMRRLGRRATGEALETLLDAVGGDLRSLAGACSQLASDTEGGIDVDAVRRYYEGCAEVSGFAVADRAIEGQVATALVQLRWALHAGTDPVPLVAALAMGLRHVAKVAAAPRGTSPADLARDVGVPPWKVEAVRRQVRGWTPEGIAVALTAVAEADAQVKGGGADPVYALEKALVSIGRARGSR